MKLLEVARILTLLDESIDIHGLARLHQGNPWFDRAVYDYKATLQGRKKDLLKPFGLDNLDKFMKNPEGFVKMVDYALDSFKEKKEQKALYKKIYEDDRCLITMPKGPEGAAAAGSFCKADGEVVCPWCVCIKYPENEKWWEMYDAAALFFIYSKENGVATDACCVLLTASDALSVLKGSFAYSQVEGIENEGLAENPDGQRDVLERLYGKTGLSDSRLTEILVPVLEPMEGEFRGVALSNDLIAAAKKGDAGRVMRCLEGGADVNAQNKQGHTPLLWVAYTGHLEICKTLIEAGADVNARDNESLTPLHWAADYGRLVICKLLIKSGADVNTPTKHGITPLHLAVRSGRLETCKFLISAGADASVSSENGWTPLHQAVERDFTNICKLLIDAGANVNARNSFVSTPLHWAANRGLPETCKLLIDAGADVNAVDEEERSPLYWAARYGRLENCKLLIDAGADVNSLDKYRQTPIDTARSRGHTKVVELLSQAGAME